MYYRWPIIGDCLPGCTISCKCVCVCVCVMCRHVVCVVNMCLYMHAVCYVCYLCCVSVRVRVVYLCVSVLVLYILYMAKLWSGKNFIFCGFSVDHESFPLESLAVYSTWWPRPDAPHQWIVYFVHNRESFPTRKFCCIRHTCEYLSM